MLSSKILICERLNGKRSSAVATGKEGPVEPEFFFPSPFYIYHKFVCTNVKAMCADERNSVKFILINAFDRQSKRGKNVKCLNNCLNCNIA